MEYIALLTSFIHLRKGLQIYTYPCAPPCSAEGARCLLRIWPCTNSEEKEEVTESLQDPKEEETRWLKGEAKK